MRFKITSPEKGNSVLRLLPDAKDLGKEFRRTDESVLLFGADGKPIREDA